MASIHLPNILISIPRNPGRPPRQVFPIVWPILDSLTLGIALYYAQLFMNFAWSPLFFNAKQIGLALIDSALMAGTTYYMTKLLDEPTQSKTTYFLLPYCAWLTFATYLNGGIWWLNRGRRDLSKED
ncbi:hypothetical protein WG66_012166 [Moniliophthora roreri]|nr:hypothetical protein WG66_012166 [Moniliophthora roreri]